MFAVGREGERSGGGVFGRKAMVSHLRIEHGRRWGNLKSKPEQTNMRRVMSDSILRMFRMNAVMNINERGQAVDDRWYGDTG